MDLIFYLSNIKFLWEFLPWQSLLNQYRYYFDWDSSVEFSEKASPETEIELKFPEKEVAPLKMEAAKFVASIYIGSSNLLRYLNPPSAAWIEVLIPHIHPPNIPLYLQKLNERLIKELIWIIDILLDIIFYLSNIKFLCEFPPWQSLLN